MNTSQARDISIEKVLQNLGCESTISNTTDIWYLSPFRIEKTASFKVNRKLNRWFDHGEQQGGNVIDFVILKFGFSVSEALNYLEQFSDFISPHQHVFEVENKVDHIEKIIPVQHLALIQYLQSRGISNFHNTSNLKEVHYSIKDKKYFALGFRNNSGGFEIRSKYAKICLGNKDISYLKSDRKSLTIFEGFFDFLSFFQSENQSKKSDYLILNSVALISKNIEILKNYETINLYLDNDSAGDKYTNLIIEKIPNAVDCRAVFKDYKDLNEYYVANQTKKEVL